MRKIIKKGKEALLALQSGVNQASDLITITLGPSGRNSIYGRPYHFAEITNDGKTIAEQIYLDDEIDQLGAERIKLITSETFEKAGDSTTTTVALYQAIFNKGVELILNDDPYTIKSKDPILVKKEILEACSKVCKEIEKQSKPVNTLEEMFKVAFGATEDEKLAKLIANMWFSVGKNGSVTCEDGYDEMDSKISEGLEIEAGLPSEIMANKEDKTFTLDNPLILVTNFPIEFQSQISSLTIRLSNEGIKNLIIIADHFSKEILSSFTIAKATGSINIIAIKAPYFGKKERMEDIAISLGAKFFDKDLPLQLQQSTKDDLGTAKKIISDLNTTVFIKPKGDTKERINELKLELKKSKSTFDKNNLTKRIAHLSGGIGVIMVGSETNDNKGYLKKKVLNGINAVKSSMQEGAVKGGGLCLKTISETIEKNILTDILVVPYNKIQQNCGGYLEIKDNVMDSARSVKTALINACEGAGTLLTVDSAIADKYEEPKDFKDE